MKKETRNPFVGIAPFIEDDYERFFGRDSEKAVALRYIESYRITVLTGPSGCGKTSLVHSGIVHALRMRWREKRHNSLGLPLVIRSWGSGAVKEGGLDELGVQGLFTKILIRDNPTLFSSPEQERVEENFSAGAEAAAEWLAEHSEMKKELSKRSAEIASGNVGDKYAFKVIVDVIARACKGAVVIFDQFEEILRVGEPVVNQVSALIAHLVSLENVRVVLSLRQEHLGDLKYIERNVTPLGKSTIHLEIMPLPTAKDALDRMGSIWAHKNGYNGFEVAAEMLRALRPSAGVDDGADLIYYQAILLQMWECLYGKESTDLRSRGRTADAQMVVFDEEALRKAFRNELERGGDLKADHIFEIALSKIMASVFIDNMLLEYIAVRIFPLLSLGGFKVTADEERLFAAIIDDKTEKKTKERMRGHFRECLDHLSMESIGGDNKAGVGDEYNKRPVNILKGYPASFLAPCKHSSEKERPAHWELVHDRLGPPLNEWARRRRNSIADARAAASGGVTCHGLTPVGVDEAQVLDTNSSVGDWRNLKWLGCTIAPTDTVRSVVSSDGKKHEGARFVGITFDQCDFSGSIFERLIFEHCVFRKCKLNGAFFLNCVFERGRFESLEEGQGNTIGMFGVTFKGLTFHDCFLVQPTFKKSWPVEGCEEGKGITLTADVKFEQCIILSARFESRAGGSGKFEFDEWCKGEFLSWDDSFEGNFEELKSPVRKFRHSAEYGYKKSPDQL